MRFRALNFKTHTADGGFKTLIPCEAGEPLIKSGEWKEKKVRNEE